MEKFGEFIKEFNETGACDTDIYEQLLYEVNKNPGEILDYIKINSLDKTGLLGFMAGLEMGFKFNQYLNKEVMK
jgi:hypothetical protein